MEGYYYNPDKKTFELAGRYSLSVKELFENTDSITALYKKQIGDVIFKACAVNKCMLYANINVYKLANKGYQIEIKDKGNVVVSPMEMPFVEAIGFYRDHDTITELLYDKRRYKLMYLNNNGKACDIYEVELHANQYIESEFPSESVLRSLTLDTGIIAVGVHGEYTITMVDDGKIKIYNDTAKVTYEYVI